MFKEIRTINHNQLSNEEFQSTFLPAMPIKIKGLGESWPAMNNWSEHFFKKNYGNLIVPVRKYGAGSDYIRTHMKLSTYLEYLNNVERDANIQDKLYLADWEISKQHSPLLEDFATPLYFKDDLFNELPTELKFGRTWIFIGHKLVSTPLHQDTFSTSAWLTMIQGSKLIRLIPPNYADFIDQSTSLYDDETISKLIEKQVPIHEVEIQRGDTLFIPGRWFHEVINLNNNIMVTKNFLDKWNYLNFTDQLEKKFNKPLVKIREAKMKFIASHFDQPFVQNQIKK